MKPNNRNRKGDTHVQKQPALKLLSYFWCRVLLMFADTYFSTPCVHAELGIKFCNSSSFPFALHSDDIFPNVKTGWTILATQGTLLETVRVCLSLKVWPLGAVLISFTILAGPL